jgi:hypothetical protein
MGQTTENGKLYLARSAARNRRPVSSSMKGFIQMPIDILPDRWQGDGRRVTSNVLAAAAAETPSWSI